MISDQYYDPAPLREVERSLASLEGFRKETVNGLVAKLVCLLAFGEVNDVHAEADALLMLSRRQSDLRMRMIVLRWV